MPTFGTLCWGIVHLAVSFANSDGEWWDDYHWERTRPSQSKSPQKKRRNRSKSRKQRPDDGWIYQERKKLTPGLRYQILNRDGYRCQICGTSAIEGSVRLEIDHVVPVAKGGRTEPKNLRTLCQDCNSGKSDRDD